MNNRYYRIVLLCLILTFNYAIAEVPLKLWYKQPAKDWMQEALPIGNGYMGAMFFGGIGNEQLQFSEGSLWAGGPGANPKYNNGNRPGAWRYLEQVRQLIREGKLKEADALVAKELLAEPPIKIKGDQTSWGDFGAQQTMGDLFVKLGHGEVPVTAYRRELDISEAIGQVSYAIGKNHYKRTYFGSYPKGVMVYRFESSAPESYAIIYKTPQQKTRETFANNRYVFTGYVLNNKQAFEMAYQVLTDGQVQYANGEVKVSGAKWLIILHTAATEYQMRYPDYKGNDYAAVVDKRLQEALPITYERLKQEHVQDFRRLFDRVGFHLEGIHQNDIPTDERQKSYFEGAKDVGMEELYFQYGRYLMIAASRIGTMPMHLQGKWNNSVDPPWAADYHMNINVQMLYWPAEVTNLAECTEPLSRYIGSLVPPGRQSAQDFFHTRGWVVNTMNNAFGYTAINAGLPWGFFPGGAAWLCQHLWEHYAFSGDQEYLRKEAYPVMQEAARFWMDYLTPDEQGFLVSSPSYSPEHGGISGGASMDHQIAWDVLNNCAEAAKVLGDQAFADSAIRIRDKILPPKIGHWGQLQEWKEDVDDPNDKHRHVSHLFALHPGRQISAERTPALVEAAKVSLEARGDEGTGWSLAWKVNFWARLKDGNRAHKLYSMIIKPAGSGKEEGGNVTYDGEGSGSYANLLDAHPPFQLDGNMGATAGVAELLLQSQTDKLELLPALPDDWKNGEITGLRARTGYMVSIAWENGHLKKAVIIADHNGPKTIFYQGKSKQAEFVMGRTYTLTDKDFN